MKVSELTGAQLDYWVARAEGVADGLVEKDGRMCRVREWDPDYYSWRDSLKDWVMWMDYAPSQRWDHGGPIIEQKHIRLMFYEDEGWGATVFKADGDTADYLGPTPLVAAMRSYVASEFGYEVDESQQS